MNQLVFIIIFLSVLLIGLICVCFLLYRKYNRAISKSSKDEIIEAEEMFSQLLDNMPDPIYIKDRASKFLLANKHTSLIMGVKDPKKLIGKTDFDFYEERLARDYYDDEQRVMNDNKAMLSKEEKGLNLDGKEIFVSTSKIPMRDSKGRAIGIIGIGRDITPQKEAELNLQEKSESLKETNVLLEERQEEIQQMAEELNAQAEHLKQINIELERLSLVASKTENTVIIMDGNANFQWVNEGFEKRYGLNLEQYKTEYGGNLRDNSSNENISAILNQIYITQKPYTYNSKFENKDGEVIWSQSNISPILNSKKEIASLVLIDSDITELKIAESKIKKQNAEIEIQSRELVKINATKDRLFSIIAHDLKNPFNSILGFTEILQKQYKVIERGKLNELLEMIGSSTKSAYQLLENLLDWARAQSNNVSYKPVMLNIKEIITEISSLLSLQGSNKGIEFENNIDGKIHVFADRNMLNTVFRNLTSNAIKYTSENGKITFTGGSNGIDTTINIQDTGIGIPEDKLKDLFKLDRVKSTAGTAGETGTGLGLIVCQEFIAKNNGSISVSSIPGKGSTFTITLPSKEN